MVDLADRSGRTALHYAALLGHAPAVALLFNDLAQPAAAAPVRLAAGFPPGVASYTVFDAAGAAVTAQLVPLSPRDAELRSLYNGSAAPVQWLCFTAALPAPPPPPPPQPAKASNINQQ
jgi:ankyrin repeat protein